MANSEAGSQRTLVDSLPHPQIARQLRTSRMKQVPDTLFGRCLLQLLFEDWDPLTRELTFTFHS